MLNHLSFVLPREYGPKGVATALQLVVPAPRNEQEIREVISTAATEHIESTSNKNLHEVTGHCFQSF